MAPAEKTITCRYCLNTVDAAHTITDTYNHNVSCGYCGGSLDEQEQEAIKPTDSPIVCKECNSVIHHTDNGWEVGFIKVGIAESKMCGTCYARRFNIA